MSDIGLTRSQKMRIQAEMARHGLHQGQRCTHHDDYDRRVDWMDREGVIGFLRTLDGWSANWKEADDD